MPRKSKFGEINKKYVIVTIGCVFVAYLVYLYYQKNSQSPAPKSSFGRFNTNWSFPTNTGTKNNPFSSGTTNHTLGDAMNLQKNPLTSPPPPPPNSLCNTTYLINSCKTLTDKRLARGCRILNNSLKCGWNDAQYNS